MATLKDKAGKPALGRKASAAGLASRAKKRGYHPSDISRVSHLLKSVADPIRLDILMSLVCGEMGAAELSEEVGRSIPAVSHHLALLRFNRLILPHRRGQKNYYRLTEGGRILTAALSNHLGLKPTRRQPVAEKVEIDPDLLSDVRGFVDDPVNWFQTPNGEFEGRKPVELLGTRDEARLRNRIGAAKLGLFS